MKEKLPSSQQKWLRDQVIDEIRFTGDAKVWGTAFRGFCNLKRKIESGKQFWLNDLRKASALYDGFEYAFGDADMVLDEWKHAQNRQSLAHLS